MATEKRLIRLSDLMKFPIRIDHYDNVNGNEHFVYGIETVLEYAENLPTVDAVEVNKLGELGRLMMPYKGCQRGRIGATGTVGLSGCVYADLHIKELNPIEDVDGNLWVPVLEEDLRRLKARQVGAVEVVHGRWVMGFSVRCSVCNGYALTDEDHDPWLTPYCPNCGAKMDGGSHEVD